MWAATKNYEKFVKNPTFGGSRSFKVIGVDKAKSLLPVLVTMSNMYVRICNRFHTKRASNCKIRFFERYPSLTPPFEENPFTQRNQISSQKLKFLGQHIVKI